MPDWRAVLALCAATLILATLILLPGRPLTTVERPYEVLAELGETRLIGIDEGDLRRPSAYRAAIADHCAGECLLMFLRGTAPASLPLGPEGTGRHLAIYAEGAVTPPRLTFRCGHPLAAPDACFAPDGRLWPQPATA